MANPRLQEKLNEFYRQELESDVFRRILRLAFDEGRLDAILQSVLDDDEMAKLAAYRPIPDSLLAHLTEAQRRLLFQKKNVSRETALSDA